MYRFIDDEEIAEVEAKPIIEKNKEERKELKKILKAEELATIKLIKNAQKNVMQEKNDDDEITKTTIIDIEKNKDIVIEDKYLDLEKIAKKYDERPRTEKFQDGKCVLVKDFEDIKEYIHKYLIISIDGFYYHRMGKKWININTEQLNTLYLSKFRKGIREWFKNDNFRRHKIVSLVNLPTGINVINRHGQTYYYLNTFAGFMHANEKKRYDEYPEEIKNKVDIFLKYIYDVLADGNKDSYDYIVKWYANMCQGKKNDTILYLKGPEGIGKSSMSDMIVNYVLGSKICTLSDTTPLVTKNNGNWIGKLYVIFEEFPTMSENMWNYCSCKLKSFTTEKYSMYGEMHTKQIQLKNIHNFQMNTNVDAIKDSNGRRVFCADVSIKYKQNHSYFANLRENCFNIEVGEALYNYFLSIDVSKFQPQRDMPLTKNKIDSINNNLAIELQFIKDKILFNGEEGKYTPDELYEEFILYLASIKYTRNIKKKLNFIKGLRDNGIEYETGRSRYNFYNLKYATILELFKKNHWIHELDMDKLFENKESETKKVQGYNFIEEKPVDIKPVEVKPVVEVSELQKQYDELQKKYDDLKALILNQQLTKKIKVYKEQVKKSKNENEHIMDEYVILLDEMKKMKPVQVVDIVDNGDDNDESDSDDSDNDIVDEKVIRIREYAKKNASTLLLCFD